MHSRLVATLSAAVVVLATAVILLAIVIVRGTAEVAPHGTPEVSLTSDAPPASGAAPRVFDANALATTISRQYEEKFGDSVVQVSCPGDEPVVVGRVFYCSVAGRTERIEITVKSEDGDYVWQPTGS